MRVFSTKVFNRWARKQGLNNSQLKKAVTEIQSGLIDADLGHGLLKKRIAKPGQGKSGGWRTLLAYKAYDRTFFLYGFAKNDRGNISHKEEKALHLLAESLFNLSDQDLEKAILVGELLEL